MTGRPRRLYAPGYLHHRPVPSLLHVGRGLLSGVYTDHCQAHSTARYPTLRIPVETIDKHANERTEYDLSTSKYSKISAARATVRAPSRHFVIVSGTHSRSAASVTELFRIRESCTTRFVWWTLFRSRNIYRQRRAAILARITFSEFENL